MADETAPPGAPDPSEPELGSGGYVKAAFSSQYNVIVLAGAAAFALVSGSALPLLLTAGLELIYLSVVPQNGRFRRLVRSRRYEEAKRRHESNVQATLEAMLRELPPDLSRRYTALHDVCGMIRANHARLSSSSQILVKQLQGKLQGLLQVYVRLLHAAHEHDRYLRATDGEDIRREADALERKLPSEAPKVQEINRKRVEILAKRLEKLEGIRENRQVMEAQRAALEDMLELIRDQSVTMRDPQELSDRLDSLVHEVEHTEGTVQGEGRFNDGRTERTLVAGDTVIFPAGEGHQVTAMTTMVLYRVQAGADRHPESLDRWPARP